MKKGSEECILAEINMTALVEGSLTLTQEHRASLAKHLRTCETCLAVFLLSLETWEPQMRCIDSHLEPPHLFVCSKNHCFEVDPSDYTNTTIVNHMQFACCPVCGEVDPRATKGTTG